VKLRRKPVIEVMQFSNDPQWFINTPHPLILPNPNKSATDMPGTLYQTWDTPEEAERVARWWGFRPVRVAAGRGR
jgi:hypothetical protein